jgi:3,4-dihydroxy 2-butanone 4-phosphate synthase
MNEDGTMMRGAAIEAFARERGLPILTIAEMIEWRTRTEQQAA